MRKLILGENIIEISISAPKRKYALIFFYSPARCETIKMIVPVVVCQSSVSIKIDTCVGPLDVGDYSMSIYLQDSYSNMDPLFADRYYTETVQVRSDICKERCFK